MRAFEPRMPLAGAGRLEGKDELRRCGKTRPHAHKLGAYVPSWGKLACPIENCQKLPTRDAPQGNSLELFPRGSALR